MTAKNTLEHRDERLEEAAEYASSARNNDWNKSNFGEDFRKELQAINGDAALAFDKQTDMAGFPPDKREEYLSAYAQGFNKLDFATHSDRRDAATGLAQNIYKPLFEKVELAEAGISQGAAAQLKQMGYDKAEKAHDHRRRRKAGRADHDHGQDREGRREDSASSPGRNVLTQDRILDFHLTQAVRRVRRRPVPEQARPRTPPAGGCTRTSPGPWSSPARSRSTPRDKENDPRTVDFRWVEETRERGEPETGPGLPGRGELGEQPARPGRAEEEGVAGRPTPRQPDAASKALMEPYREEHGPRCRVREPGNLPGRSRGHGGGQRVSSPMRSPENRAGFIEDPGYSEKPELPGQIRGPANVPENTSTGSAQVMEDHSAGMDVNVAIAARSIQEKMEEHWREGGAHREFQLQASTRTASTGR